MNRPYLNRAVFVFALLGAIIAGYLWNLHSHPVDIACGPSHGCETVANSRYSRFPFGSGPPVAAYGTLGYLALATLAFLRTLTANPRRDRGLLALVVLGATFGTVASLFFTYLEIFKIHAICRWCVGSQVVILIVWALSLADWFSSSAPASSRPKGVPSE
jgi:uncharacterized membrane protein